MKKIAIIILIVILGILGTGIAQAQKCLHYHENNCDIPDYTYYYNGQSKSALFKRGQTSELKVVVFEGEEYYISVCGDKKLGQIRFRILEDNELHRVLYDNSQHGFTDNMTFTNTASRKIVIEVSIPPVEVRPNSKEKVDANATYCAGVLIAFKKTFNPQDDPIGF